MVLLLSTGSEVSEWAQVEQSDVGWVLESHRKGSANQVGDGVGGDEENSGFPYRASSAREED